MSIKHSNCIILLHACNTKIHSKNQSCSFKFYQFVDLNIGKDTLDTIIDSINVLRCIRINLLKNTKTHCLLLKVFEYDSHPFIQYKP